MADLTYNQIAKIKVFGIGGAGSNAVNRMVQEGVQGVEFYVANTDLQALDVSPVANKIQLGREGLGAGGNPDNGRKAAVESEDAIRQAAAVMQQCREVICCTEYFGAMNQSNRKLKEQAEALETRDGWVLVRTAAGRFWVRSENFRAVEQE